MRAISAVTAKVRSLDNWVKVEAAGRLRDVRGKPLTAEQMEVPRYAFIERHRGTWPIMVLNHVLRVSSK